MEKTIVYFEKPGHTNTDETLMLAKRRTEELGIKKVLVATTHGNTPAKAVDVFNNGFKIIAVTKPYGRREPNTLEITDENRRIIEGKGGTILATTHGFGGIARPFSLPLNENKRPYPAKAPTGDAELIAYTLFIFSSGMKVCCEIALMAADAGLVRTDEEVLSIAGTHSGADTAVIIQPANVFRFWDLRIKEIICKPRR